MKQKKKIAIKILIVICIIFIIGFLIFNNLTKTKDNYTNIGDCRYAQFWENPEDVDVLFMGSSHMYYAISPMELWNSYGIKSYDLTAPSSSIPLTYWTLKCALRETTPKLVVMDTYHLSCNAMIGFEDLKNHIALDAIPKTKVKVKAVNELFADDEKRIDIYANGTERKKYSKPRFKSNILFKYSKGCDIGCETADTKEFEYVDKDNYLEKDTRGKEYLEKIIKLCKDKKIKLVLTAMPCYCKKIEQQGINTSRKIAESKGVDFFDFKNMDIINPKTCMNDEQHLNSIGNRIITKRMGEILKDKYKIKDNRSFFSINSHKWNRQYSNYYKTLGKKSEEAKKFIPSILWVADDNHKVVLYLKGGNTSTMKRINNLLNDMGNVERITKDEAKEYMGDDFKKNCCLIVKDKKDNVIYKAVFAKGRKIAVER